MCVALVAGFYRFTRTGIALRAIADDAQAAMAAGIDVDRHLLIVWCLTGVVAVVAGVLWTSVNGGGFGVGLIGLKVFPIVHPRRARQHRRHHRGVDRDRASWRASGRAYLDRVLGSGFGGIAPYLALLAMLMVRPQGLFGQPRVERV